MRKTLMAAALAIPMALLAVSTFAATPVVKPYFFSPAQVAQTRLVPQDLAAQIFTPAREPAPALAAFGIPYAGVCSVTCEECYGPSDCPSYPGMRQYCAGACN